MLQTMLIDEFHEKSITLGMCNIDRNVCCNNNNIHSNTLLSSTYTILLGT